MLPLTKPMVRMKPLLRCAIDGKTARERWSTDKVLTPTAPHPSLAQVRRKGETWGSIETICSIWCFSLMPRHPAFLTRMCCTTSCTWSSLVMSRSVSTGGGLNPCIIRDGGRLRRCGIFVPRTARTCVVVNKGKDREGRANLLNVTM